MVKQLLIDRLVTRTIDAGELTAGVLYAGAFTGSAVSVPELRVQSNFTIGQLSVSGMSAGSAVVTSLTGGTIYASSIYATGLTAAQSNWGAAVVQGLTATSMYCSAMNVTSLTASNLYASGGTFQQLGVSGTLSYTSVKANSVMLQNPTGYNPFGKNVLAYYDFLNPDYIGEDRSGNQNHALPQGAQVTTSSTYTTAQSKTFSPTLFFTQKRWDATIVTDTTISEGAQFLDFTQLVPEIMATPDVTFSFWIIPRATTTQYLMCIGLRESPNATPNRVTIACGDAEGVALEMCDGSGGTNLSRRYGLRSGDGTSAQLTLGKWYHVVASVGASGAKLYVDGVLRTNTYVTSPSGSVTDPLKSIHATKMPNFAVFGCAAAGDGSTQTAFNGLFRGSMAQVLIMPLSASQSLVDSLYAGNYGYDVYPLLGSENMVGSTTYTTGIDDTMAGLTGRAYQYSLADGAVTPVAHPLDFSFDSLAPAVPGFTGASLWKTFADGVVARTHPARRMMFVPCAKSLTSFRGGCTGDGATTWSSADSGGIYATASALIQSALATHPLNQVAAVLWQHGELDETNVRYGYYVQNTLSSLLATTGFSPMTQLLVGEPVNATGSAQHLRNFVNASPMTRSFIPTSGLATTGFYGADVFTPESMRVVGQRYASALNSMGYGLKIHADHGLYQNVPVRLHDPCFQGLRYDYTNDVGTASRSAPLSLVTPTTNNEVLQLQALGVSDSGTLKIIYNSGGYAGNLQLVVRAYRLDQTYQDITVPAKARRELMWMASEWVV